MGGMVSKYLATPEGQAAVLNYLTSDEGIAMLKQFIATPGGKKAMFSILPSILDGLCLSSEVKDAVRDSIEKSV